MIRTHNRVIIVITVKQQPRATFPDRNTVLLFTFVKEFEVNSTWRDLTDKGKIVIPKNIFVRDGNGKPVALMNTNVNIGGFSTAAPLFLRGDKVSIKWGYAYFDDRGNDVAPMVDIFNGYISEVTSHKPFQLAIMDSMYILQQYQAPVKEWVGYDVEGVLEAMIKQYNLPLTVNHTTSTKIGNFRTGNETIAQVLARLRKLYNFEAYFRGTELRCGSFVYLEADVNQNIPTFRFQWDIISDSLQYSRKDDLTVSMLAQNTIEEETGHMTKDGKAKTKKVRLRVLLTYQNGSATPTKYILQPHEQVPDNVQGQRFTGFYPGAKTIDDLIEAGLKDLQKYYYTGFKGKFTTFGMPYVKHGDNINIINDLLPEQNGRYKVKEVQYTGGIGGLRQEITLHYLLFRIDKKGNILQ